jgi:hypothetical protein
VTGTRQAESDLRSALQEYAQADTYAKRASAILSLQDGLDSAFRAYLARLGVADIDSLPAGYPALVNLVRDHTNLFAGDPSLPALLVSLNNTRNKIAHPKLGKPTASELARDADQYVKVIRRFWPIIFREPSPQALPATRAAPKPRPQPVPLPRREPSPDEREPQPSRWPRVRQLFRTLWSDENAPRLQKWLLVKRVVGIILFLVLAKILKDAALFTARWPQPVKYGGVVLFVLAMAFFVWSLILIWKVLRQIRLKGLLIAFAAIYVLLLSAVVLTSTSSLPWVQVGWQTTRNWVSLGSSAVVDAASSIVSAPAEFRVAYLGYRRPVRVPGTDPDDPSYLTPIPANRPATAVPRTEPTPGPGQPTAESTATPEVVDASLPLPDCPEPQARLTAPRVGQVIRDQGAVMGTAKIDGFDYYKFEYRRAGDATDTWHWIASFYTPVEDGFLGTWDVSGLPADRYILRLTVVNTEGNYPFPPCEVTVQVASD